VLIDIHTLKVVRGSMPRRVLALAAELLEDWTLCELLGEPPKTHPKYGDQAGS
jgi:hypothetical protein